MDEEEEEIEPFRGVLMEYNCSPKCPFLKEYKHPYFEHTAWCDHMLIELDREDFWIAACKFN